MAKRTSVLLALALLWGLCQAAVCMAADPEVKTSQKKDTLLYIRTDPSGAKVYLDGKELGKSNDIFAVDPGVGTIVIELPGHETNKKQVTIQANKVNRIELVLKPQAGAENGQTEQAESSPKKIVAENSYVAEQLKQASAGNYWAKYNLWAAYHKGMHGVEKNPEEAKKWLDKVVKGVYLAKFRPVHGFEPKNPGEFLSKFNEHSDLQSEQTSIGGASFFRTKNKDGMLIGSFLTEYPEKMRKAIANNPSLQLISIEKLTPEAFVPYEASPQESLRSKKQTPSAEEPDSHDRLKSLTNLRQLMLAMHNYADAHGRFPPAVRNGLDGKTPHSWRSGDSALLGL